MIGGFEFELSGAPASEDIGRILRLVRAGWPTCVLETADGVLTASIQQALRHNSATNQFFVYRDLASKKSWDEHGLADENSDAMISVIIDKEFILIIADDQHSFAGELAENILRGVLICRNNNRLVPMFSTYQPMQVTL